ncbi:uncharacterized protein LOC114290524 [Camellia sinensis]|uniref:uncharacterized protein LOC114290524 n=1 Tax=Camellia sinensis TaxID=4442 RepID=UPI001035CB26|nr:uncharacterized protein LOC114290524 [Camellia sinensis]
MISWIKACMSSPSFSICINGSFHGHFKGARGLRQGDPMSPYLLVLAMEGLARILDEKTKHPLFKFHWRCEKTKIVNLCFADDLMIFSKGDVNTVRMIMVGLEEFSSLSGLTPNPSKSNVFFSGCNKKLRDDILQIASFSEGTLPVKYLGVPLITTKLKASNCKQLVDRITKRISSWTNKLLSYAGRSQLIQTILKHCAKIAWDKVCTPKKEGDLGFKSLEVWNKAAIAKHVWFLFSGGTKSMWCQWVKSYLLKGKSFWKVKSPSDPSWVWRKILSLRPVIYPLIHHKIGNGRDTFLWYDNWHPLGSLWDKYADRILYDSGLNSDAKVSQVIEGNSWKWPFPTSWELRDLISHPNNWNPNSLDMDKVVWYHNPDGDFTIKSVWDLWRNKESIVPWYKLVWGAYTIPKVSFIVWLAIHGRLNTSDRLHLFGISPSTTCPFCLDPNESHAHIFFGCTFTYSIWLTMQGKCNIHWIDIPWPDIVAHANQEGQGKSLKAIITRLSFLCTVYHVWIERNNRIFNKECKPVGVIIKSIVLMVKEAIPEFCEVLLQCLDDAYHKFSTWGCISENQVSLVDVVRTCEVIWFRGMAASCAFWVAQSVNQLSFNISLFCNYYTIIDVLPTLVGCTRDYGLYSYLLTCVLARSYTRKHMDLGMWFLSFIARVWLFWHLYLVHLLDH